MAPRVDRRCCPSFQVTATPVGRTSFGGGGTTSMVTLAGTFSLIGNTFFRCAPTAGCRVVEFLASQEAPDGPPPEAVVLRPVYDPVALGAGRRWAFTAGGYRGTYPVYAAAAGARCPTDVDAWLFWEDGRYVEGDFVLKCVTNNDQEPSAAAGQLHRAAPLARRAKQAEAETAMGHGELLVPLLLVHLILMPLLLWRLWAGCRRRRRRLGAGHYATPASSAPPTGRASRRGGGYPNSPLPPRRSPRPLSPWRAASAHAQCEPPWLPTPCSPRAHRATAQHPQDLGQFPDPDPATADQQRVVLRLDELSAASDPFELEVLRRRSMLLRDQEGSDAEKPSPLRAGGVGARAGRACGACGGGGSGGGGSGGGGSAGGRSRSTCSEQTALMTYTTSGESIASNSPARVDTATEGETSEGGGGGAAVASRRWQQQQQQHHHQWHAQQATPMLAHPSAASCAVRPSHATGGAAVEHTAASAPPNPLAPPSSTPSPRNTAAAARQARKLRVSDDTEGEGL